MKLAASFLAFLGGAASAQDFAASRVSSGEHGPVDGSVLREGLDGPDEPLIGEEGYDDELVGEDGWRQSMSNLSSSELGGEMLDASTLRRKLQEGQIAPLHYYRPLPCDPALPNVPSKPTEDQLVGAGCTKLSENPGETTKIDACTCVYVDQASVDANGEIVVPGGMDIQGLLVFPHNMHVTVKTQYVFLQGKLQISNDEEIQPGRGVKFFMTGTAEHTFTPAPTHFNLNNVNAGNKPFLVAGGSLNIDGWKDGCPTWLNIDDVVFDEYEDGVAPGFYDAPVDPPEGCGGRTVVENDFEAGQGGWNGRLGGIDTTETETVTAVEVDEFGNTVSATNSFLRVDNRTRAWQGPAVSLNQETRKCIACYTDYFFSARFRLSRADGQPTNCASKGENCLMFNLYHKDSSNNHDHYWTRAQIQANQGEGRNTGMDMVKDNEWFTWVGRVQFSCLEADPARTIAERIQIYGPEEGVTIDMDDFTLGLAPLEGFPTDADASSGEICQELFPADSGANGYYDPPMYPYPLKANNHDYHSNFVIMKEDDAAAAGGVNYFYRNAHRYYHWHSMTWDLTRGCLKLGAHYRVTLRARVNSPKSFPSARPQIIFRPAVGNGWAESGPAREAGGGKGWVDYSMELIVDERMADAAATGRVEFRFDAGHHGTYADVDYDDVSVKLVHGPIKGLVVGDQGVDQCWGGGSQIVVTSHTTGAHGDQVVTLASPAVSLDGDKAVLNINTTVGALPKYPTTAAQDAKQACEVALLGRNIKFEGDTDVANKGGYLLVRNTFNVTQKIRGADFYKFGHRSVGNRYPIGFDKLDKVPGGKIEYNLIRKSHMRCVIFNGVEGLTIHGNVAHDNNGLCFGSLAGREIATVTNNLAVRTRDTNIDRWNTAGFFLRDPRIVFKGNVAAGSDKRGIRYSLDWRTNTGYRSMAGPWNWNPRDKALGAFEDNVAHSCGDWGMVITAYHPRYNEPNNKQWFKRYRGYKNRNNAHVNARDVGMEGWYLADARERNMDLEWDADYQIEDMQIVGFSPVYRSQVESDPKIWHICKQEKHLVDRMIGFEVFHKRGWIDWGGYDRTTPGTVMNNVRLEGFSGTDCARTNPLYAQRHREQPHYDAFLAIEGMSTSTMDDVPSLCSFEDLEVQDVVISDADSSLGPMLAGKELTGPSSIVSNYDYMKGLAGGTCHDNADKCLSYCENTCLQFVSWSVDPYETEDVLLVVTDNTDGTKTISVPGNFYFAKHGDGSPNLGHNTYFTRMRKFSAALPAGDYTAKFTKGGQPYWPKFAYDRYERKPPCMGDGQVTVTLEVPDPTLEECVELAKNGDLEELFVDYANSTGPKVHNYTNWMHVNGGVHFMEGEGVDGTCAVLNKRSHPHHGVGFYVDTRCAKLMEGHEYRITAKIRLFEPDGVTPATCNPDTMNEWNGCPAMWMQTRKHRQDAHVIDVWTWGNTATTVRPFNVDDYTLVDGTFAVESRMANADTILFWLTRGGTKHILVDDVSVKLHYRGDAAEPFAAAGVTAETALTAPVPNTDCPKEFVMNGGFEMGTSTEYWRSRNYHADGKMSIVSPGADGTGNALSMTEIGHPYNGPIQWLDPTCFEDGVEYEVYARFKLSKGGLPHTCDSSVWNTGSINQCPILTIQTQHGSYHLAKTIDVGDAAAGTWGTIHAIVVGNVQMASTYYAYLYAEFTPNGVDLLLDDVSFTRYEKDCSNLVRNGDAEEGTAASWFKEHITPKPVAIEPGYGGVGYALCLGKCGINDEGRYSRDSLLRQSLDKDCIETGVEYEIEARVQIRNQDNQLPATCNPNIINGPDACPIADIRTDEGGEARGRIVGSVLSADPEEGWYLLKGVFMFYDWDIAGNLLELRFFRAPKDCDLVVDDVKIQLWENAVAP